MGLIPYVALFIWHVFPFNTLKVNINMKKKIVLALGGNALGNNIREQRVSVEHTAHILTDLIEQGHHVVVTHGNGPQVGMINLAFETAGKQGVCEAMPMATCVALSQSYIGYDLQNALHNALQKRGINKPIATLITQVVVNPADPAFLNPTKPIGDFFTQEAAEKLIAAGENLIEDSGRGYRRVVASPQPVDIIEKESIKALCDAGQIVITVGGGGIPVIQEDAKLRGVDAVIDKDWASSRLAEMIDADALIILTTVEKVAINFGKPDVKWLDNLTVAEVNRYIAEEQFAKGSMLPKIEAALAFAQSKPGRVSLITKLETAKQGIEGKTGTSISL
ncbi:amino acid (carbamate) kinase [Enterobacterales bacterium 8AC]|nr:amino acid (carbamate) kinase [Enterobacterales bacterium 8AC]